MPCRRHRDGRRFRGHADVIEQRARQPRLVSRDGARVRLLVAVEFDRDRRTRRKSSDRAGGDRRRCRSAELQSYNRRSISLGGSTFVDERGLRFGPTPTRLLRLRRIAVRLLTLLDLTPMSGLLGLPDGRPFRSWDHPWSASIWRDRPYDDLGPLRAAAEVFIDAIFNRLAMNPNPRSRPSSRVPKALAEPPGKRS